MRTHTCQQRVTERDTPCFVVQGHIYSSIRVWGHTYTYTACQQRVRESLMRTHIHSMPAARERESYEDTHTHTQRASSASERGLWGHACVKESLMRTHIHIHSVSETKPIPRPMCVCVCVCERESYEDTHTHTQRVRDQANPCYISYIYISH